MMLKRKSLTLEIALSGISAALALICTVLYYYLPVAKLSCLVLSAVALTLPLCVNKVRGCALAYVAAGGLSLLILSPVAVVPYALLFGWQPVVMGFCKRYLPRKPYLTIPLKVLLFNAGMYGVFALYGLGDTLDNILSRFALSPAYWVIALVGSVLWVGYDYLMQWVWRWIAKRLKPVTAKYGEMKEEPTEQGSDEGVESDPFGTDGEDEDKNGH